MADHSGQSWFSMFNDSGAQLLGYTAEELYEIKMSGDIARYEEIFAKAQFKTFTAKVFLFLFYFKFIYFLILLSRHELNKRVLMMN